MEGKRERWRERWIETGGGKEREVEREMRGRYERGNMHTHTRI